MTQLTNAISFVNVQVYESTDGSTFTSFTGSMNEVKVSGGNLKVGDEPTGDSRLPVLTAGTHDPADIEVKIFYSEGVGDIFSKVLAAYKAGDPFYLRWEPKGATTGNMQYTTGAGFITDNPYPGGNVGDGKPVMVTLKLRVPYIDDSTVA